MLRVGKRREHNSFAHLLSAVEMLVYQFLASGIPVTEALPNPDQLRTRRVL